MTLKECYAALGGDYDEVIGRLRSERLVQKFVLKFLDDGSYDLLCHARATPSRACAPTWPLHSCWAPAAS